MTVSAPEATGKSEHGHSATPGVVEIPVGDQLAIIDEADYDLVSPHRWRPYRSESGKDYAYTVIGRKTVFLHRLILGTAGGLDTDHRDGDGLNNRRSNLRPATRSQNVANAPKSRRRDGRAWTSQFKGVCWNRAEGRWQASIRVNGRLRFLGRYDDEVAAARAYNVAALKFRGEFARLNDIPDQAAS
jgi:hypothetical protein